MNTQEMDRTIKRACRNTIGDAIRRSTACNSEKDALIFGERRWSYAGHANRTVLVVGGHPEDGYSGDENRGAER